MSTGLANNESIQLTWRQVASSFKRVCNPAMRFLTVTRNGRENNTGGIVVHGIHWQREERNWTKKYPIHSFPNFSKSQTVVWQLVIQVNIKFTENVYLFSFIFLTSCWEAVLLSVASHAVVFEPWHGWDVSTTHLPNATILRGMRHAPVLFHTTVISPGEGNNRFSVF